MNVLDIQKLKEYSLGDNTLRDYQQDNKLKVYDAWEHSNSVMLQMPTGTGKTRLFVSIIKDIFHYSRDYKVALKVLILVHRTELIDQIDEELGLRYNLAHGIIQSGEKERKIYPIQLASVQTLSRRLDKWSDKEFDFIIVDEAHHIEAKSYQKIIRTFPHAKLLGVTATPVRLNGEGFTGSFEELIISPSVKTFIDNGYLSQYEYYSVARSSRIQRDIDGIKKFSQGDYAESEIERVCDNDRVRAQVVKAYLDFANGKRGIVYTINKTHNKNLCEEFKENGIKAVAIDSDTPSEMREQYIAQFRRGEFQIICNVNLFTEGFDCPDIEFIQLARPTKSLALYLQQVGRGLRISENKEKTLFLDNVGLYNRFGFPSSRRMWKHHFEGRYLDNKIEEEVEEKPDVKSEIESKRVRLKTIEEGHEKVHLIITSDDDEDTIKQSRILELLDKYNEIYCWGINNVFKKYKRLGAIKILTESFKIKRRQFKTYIVVFDTSNPLFVDALKYREFDFSALEQQDKFPQKRKCKDAGELQLKLNSEFAKDVRDFISDRFKQDLDSYNDIEITEDDVKLLISLYKNWHPQKRPEMLNDMSPDILSFLISYSFAKSVILNEDYKKSLSGRLIKMYFI